ncbi:MAG TPA: hypothetical protein VN886_07820 [Acidimicrobiales bacterium]|nr:hypothetical protein [Acidimicrobiales bacterium]
MVRATRGIERLVNAYQEALFTLDELRHPTPDLRAKRASQRASVDFLGSQLLDRDSYLKLAEDLQSSLARIDDQADTTTVEHRQKALRSVVKEVLVGLVSPLIEIRGFRSPKFALSPCSG